MVNFLSKICIIVALIAFLSLVYAGVGLANADTSLVVLGDIGCKSTAKTNLNNIAKTELPMLGVGDYLYNCSASSIKPTWDKIQTKHGPPGNHEYDSKSSYAFAKSIMGITDKGYFSWRIGNIAIIGINQYVDYDTDSPQYEYVKLKTAQFDNRTDINWIVYVFHEPIYTPTTEGGHGPAKTFRNIYAPIIEKNDNTLVIQAHNHISGFGNVQGINQMVCGGGGQGGDSLGNLNGYEFGTTTFGYCSLNFKNDSIEAKLIGTDGNVKGSHTYTR